MPQYSTPTESDQNEHTLGDPSSPSSMGLPLHISLILSWLNEHNGSKSILQAFASSKQMTWGELFDLAGH